jgi:hypothetical protein
MKEKRQAVLQSLRHVAKGSVGETAPCIALMRCLDVVKMLEHLQMSTMMVEEIRSLNQSEPEPLNLNFDRQPTINSPTPTTEPPSTLSPEPAQPMALHFDFPNTLPVISLTLEQSNERYSLPSEMINARLTMRLREFCIWAGAPINLSRSSSYSRSVQTSTLESNISCVK